MATRRPVRTSFLRSGSSLRSARPTSRRSRLRVESLEDRSVPTAFSWSTAVSGNFNDPARWTPFGVPGAADDATIGFAGITVTSPVSTTVQSLANAGNLAISAGTFTVTNGGSDTGNITAATGTTFDLTGGTFNWTSGTLAGAGTHRVGAGATLALGGPTIKTLDSATLNNLGTVTFAGTGNFHSGNSATFANGGLFDIQTDADVVYVFGARSIFANSGTITKSSGAGLDTFINPTFNNTGGVINVNSGQLTLATGTSTGGTYNVAASSILDLTGGETQNYTGTFTGSGAGTVQLSGGAINVTLTDATFNFPPGLFQWKGGTLTGDTLTNLGTITLAGSTTKALNGLTVNNAGTVAVAGTGNFDAGNAASISNTGTLDFQADGQLRWAFGLRPTLANSGTVTKTGGIGTTSLAVTLNNLAGATVAAQSGTLSIDTAGTSAGTFTAAVEAVVDLTSGFTFNAGAAATGAGTLRLSGSSLNAAAATTVQNLTWTGGTLYGAGGLTVAGTLALAGGSAKALDGTTLTNSGTATLSGTGELQMANGAVFQNNGSFTFQSDASLRYAYGAGGNAFNNAGTVTKTTGTPGGTSGFNDVALNNAGTVNVASGILFVDAGTSTGTFDVAPGTTLWFSQSTNNLNPGATFSGTGTVLVSAGTVNFNTDVAIANLTLSGGILDGTGTATVGTKMGWTGGLVAGTVAIAPGATLAVSGGSAKVIDGGTVVNNGTATVAGVGVGEIQMANGATFQNNGSFTFQSDVAFRYAYGSGGNQFNNAGTLIKTSTTPAGTSGLNDVTLNNSGTVSVSKGVLYADGGTHTGLFNVAAGATFNFAQGDHVLNPGAAFAGEGTVQVGANGDLIVNTPVTVNHLLEDSGASAIYGTSTLTVADTFTWLAGGVYSLNPTFTLEIAPEATLTLGGTAAKVLDTATLRNLGTTVFGGTGEWQFANAATLRNLGTFDIQTDADLRYAYGAGANRVVNTGLVTKTADAGNAFFNSVTLDNTGTVEVSSGALQFNSVTQLAGGTLSGGTWRANTGASLNLPSNVTTNNANVILNGFGATFPQINGLTANNGTFQLTNGRDFTTAGALTNAGTLRVGPQSTLSVAGAFTQSAAGTFVSEIADQPASGAFGVLAVTGAATLEGKVQVDLVNGFGPTAGGNFEVMTFASQSGNFTFVSPTTPKQGDMFAPVVNPTTLVAQSIVNAADLAVNAIFVPPSANPGATVQIGFEVKNLSTTATVVTDWIDSVYLSLDGLLDPSDLLVERLSHSGTLNAGATYVAQTNAPLPGINPNDYNVIVVTDSRQFVPDTSRPNNTVVSAATLDVIVPPVTIGVTTSGTIANGQDIYYRVDLPAGKTFKIGATFEVASELEMYVSYQKVPSRTSSDQSTFPVGQTSGQIILPGTQAGPFYILLHGREGATGGKDFDLLVEELTFSITSLENARGSNLGKATVTIHGAGFTPTTTARLQGGVVDLAAAQVFFVDSTRLYATFNLNGVPADQYNVTVLNGATPTSVADAFTVTTGAAGRLVLNLSLPSISRALARTTATINYENTGETDIPAPLLSLTSDTGDLRLPEQAEYVGKSLAFIGINPDGPAGILPAGFKGKVTVEVFNTSNFNSQGVNYTLKNVADPAKPIDWAVRKDGMRPGYISPAAWDVVFANFTASVGSTLGSYQQRMADVATYMSQIGATTYDLSRLIAFEVMRSNSGQGPGTLIRAVDAQMPAPGADLTVSRFAQQTISGRYELGRFGRGWGDNWDFAATTRPNGDAVIRIDGGARYFVRRADGSYEGIVAAAGGLNSAGGKYTLRDPNGTEYVFRPDGKLDYIRDRNNNRVTATYDASLRLIGLTHNSGPALTLTYNPQGRVSSVTDSAGRTVTYEYDASGEHLTSVTDKYGTTQYDYVSVAGAAKEHALESIQWSDNTHRFFDYDSRGFFAGQSADGGTEALSVVYGAVGGVTITGPGGGAGYLQLMDERGRVRQEVDTRGGVTRRSYDDNGHQTRVVRPDGTSFSSEYDAEGRAIRQTDPLGNTSQFSWSPEGLLSAFTDASGNRTEYAYDTLGNLTRVTHPDGTFDQFGHDAKGQVRTWTNARGQTMQLSYNAMGRITQKVFADSSTADYTYDSRGNLLTATNASGTVTQTFNSLDEVATLTDLFGHTQTFSYNSVGQRTQSVDDSGFTVKYGYSPSGRLDVVKDGLDNVLAQYTYDSVGRISLEANANGTSTQYQYDTAGNVMNIVNRDGGAINSSYAYTYDALNHVATATTGGVTTTYGYDAAGQLTSLDLPGRSIQYDYDAAGNRSSVTDNGVTTTYAVNGRNQYTTIGTATFTYDADGNLASRTAGDETTTYVFNQENQLLGVGTPAAGDVWSFVLDATQNRMASTHNGVETRYQIDPYKLDSIVAEYDGTNALTAHYVQALGLVSRVSAGGETAYYDLDLVSNVVGMTDANGDYVNRYSYLPFGETTVQSAGVANPFTFQGGLGILAAGGLFHMRNRQYDAVSGQFASDDPLDLFGGDPNIRRFVGNNPVSRVDPLGLECEKKPRVDKDGKPKDNPARPANEWDLLWGWLFDHDQADRDWKNINQNNGTWVEPGADPLKPIRDIGTVGSGKHADGQAANNSSGGATAGGSCEVPPDKGEDGGADGSQSGRSPTGGGKDPNDLTGPAGFGPQGFIPGGVTLPYLIRFENLAEATLPAQIVIVTQTLDADLDLDTFELTGFGFGQYRVDVPPGRDNFFARVDATSTTDLLVDVVASLDRTTRVFSITYTSIDPVTLDFTSDTLGGFLPPNTAINDGQGFVSYTVRAKAGLPTGTQIDGNFARIVFDTNDPVDTNVTLNTIDVGQPTATVTALADISPTLTFPVAWGGQDDAGGSGVGTFDVYVSDNGGPWALWQSRTVAITADYTGLEYHTYDFYAVGYDNVGNAEPNVPGIEATTVATNGAFARADVFGADAGKKLTVGARTGLLANDPKKPGKTYTVQPPVTQPAHGALVLKPDGSFTYTPDGTFTGLDSFTYQTKDSDNVLGNVATVTLATQLVNFKTTKATATEVKGTTTVQVDLRKPATAVTTVDYTFLGGTATVADFNATPGTVTFQPGEKSKKVVITVVNDTTDEPDQKFQVVLRNAAGAVVGAKGSAVVTIKDDDAAPTVGFSVAASSAAEGAGTVTILVSLSAASEKPVTVTFAVPAGTAGGTAKFGTDYTLPAGSLTFAPGETVKSITLSLTQDTADEPDETTVVKLLKATNGKLGTKAHTLTITDDDP